MNAAARVALAFACVLFAGCAARRPPAPLPEPVPIAADDPLLATLVGSWANVVETRRSLRAGAVLKLSGPDGERRMSQNVVLARPEQLRMEIQSFLMTAAVLVTDRGQYDYFQSIDRYREGGPVYPELLWEIAGVPLTLRQAIHFLLGAPPPRPGLHPGGGERAPDGTVRVDLHDGGDRLVRRMWFAPEGPLRRAEEWIGDRIRWQVGYDRYREVGAQPFAHTIDFEFPLQGSRATVAFRTVELNPEIPDGAFRIEVADADADGDGDGAAP